MVGVWGIIQNYQVTLHPSLSQNKIIVRIKQNVVDLLDKESTVCTLFE